MDEAVKVKCCNKKRAAIIALVVFIALILVWRIFASIYAGDVQPVDGRAAMLQGAIENKKRKEQLIKETREKSPAYQNHPKEHRLEKQTQN